MWNFVELGVMGQRRRLEDRRGACLCMRRRIIGGWMERARARQGRLQCEVAFF